MSVKVKIKKPPDIKNNKEENNEQVYRTLKCPLKCVLKNYNTLQPIIENLVIDINEMVIIGYQFIRLYLLNKFNKKEELPTINKLFILDVLKTISKSTTNKGKQKNEDKIKNKEGKEDIKNFYKNEFSKLVNKEMSYTNKTHILEQTAKEMLRCIETNISTHFFKHLFKYINFKFKKSKIEEIKKEKDKKIRKKLYKKLNEEIKNLKNDIVNRKILDSKKEYHKWIKENINLLLPEKITKSVPYDVKANPIKYIKYSMYINTKIEELNAKAFAFIPQRNNIIPKNIILNTSGISDYIGSKCQNLFNHSKSELVLNCKKYQSHIWSKILKLEKRSIFNNKDYIFYNQIMTDGFGCSLLFIFKKYKNKEYGDKVPKYKDEDNDAIKLNDLTEEECDKYLNGNYKYVSVDPGCNRPLSMIDENNNYYKYSGCRRRFENYSKRTNQIILNEKKKNNIIKKETELSKFNSKTLKIDEYKKYIINKNKTNDNIKTFYNKILLRKLNFRRYIKTKQSEEVLLNEIENKFLTKLDKKNNKKLVIFYGNWSKGNTLKGCISTPNKHFKQLINKKFILLETDEFKTSKLYNKTFKEMINVKVKKGKHSKHLHEILTPKEETEKRIFVNRDNNACKNILYLGKYYLKNQSRPIEFQRDKKKVIKKEIKLVTKEKQIVI